MESYPGTRAGAVLAAVVSTVTALVALYIIRYFLGIGFVFEEFLIVGIVFFISNLLIMLYLYPRYSCQ